MWKIINSWYTRWYQGNKKPAFTECRHGADWEIWTLAPVSRPTPLAGEPLHHLGKSANRRARNSPIKKLAERVGFEPTWPLSQTVFKTASLWPLRYLSIFVFCCRCLNQLLYYITMRGSCQEKIRKSYDNKFSTFLLMINKAVCWIIFWPLKIRDFRKNRGFFSGFSENVLYILLNLV